MMGQNKIFNEGDLDEIPEDEFRSKVSSIIDSYDQLMRRQTLILTHSPYFLYESSEGLVIGIQSLQKGYSDIKNRLNSLSLEQTDKPTLIKHFLSFQRLFDEHQEWLDENIPKDINAKFEKYARDVINELTDTIDEKFRKAFENVDLTVNSLKAKMKELEEKQGNLVEFADTKIKELVEENQRNLNDQKEHVDVLIKRSDDKIQNGIDHLIDLKTEFKMENTFGININAQRSSALRSRNLFFGAFVLILLMFPLGILLALYLVNKSALAEQGIWIHVSVGIPLTVLSIFLFNQYRVYQLMFLKYSHLSNFIGGGAAFIKKLMELDPDNSQGVDNKLANMFIDNDDLMSSIKKIKHPTEGVVEGINKMLQNIPKMVDSLGKLTK